MPFPNIGPGELILILVIALIILGPGRLPEVASSLGRSVREFRKAATDVKDAASLDSPSSGTSQATAPSSESEPSANQLHGSSEPNRLTEPDAASTTPSPAERSGSAEQHSGSASS